MQVGPAKVFRQVVGPIDRGRLSDANSIRSRKATQTRRGLRSRATAPTDLEPPKSFSSGLRIGLGLGLR